MSETPLQSLSEDVQSLKALVLDQQKMLGENEQSLRWQQVKIDQLQEQLNLLLHKRFAPSSEKAPAEQLSLFNEAEADEEPVDEDTQVTIIAEHERKKRGRKALPECTLQVCLQGGLRGDHQDGAITRTTHPQE